MIADDEARRGLFGSPRGRETGAAAGDDPLPTGHVVYEMAVVVTRQERHFEPSVRRVLGTNKEPNAESADRESPSRGVVAAPMADEPTEEEGDQPDATNPRKVMPHRRISDFALGASWPESTNLFTKEMSPSSGAGLWGLISDQCALVRGAIYANQSCLTRR